MRIISGTKASRKIKFLKTENIRPTCEKIRAAVFNSLAYTDNLVILDLFAGSAAYSLEALSRNAKYAYINDKSYQSYKIIKENLNDLGFNNYSLYRLDYKELLNKLYEEKIKVDIVFLDPPYHLGYYTDCLLRLKNILNDNFIIVLECFKKENIQLDSFYKIVKTKEYGDTKIVYLKKGE